MSWRYRRPRTIATSIADAVVFVAAAAFVILALRGFDREALAPGKVRVIDGDSLKLGPDEIRLFGIDAPEYRQTCRDKAGGDWPCGEDAAQALRNLVADRIIECTPVDTDRYGRSVAECSAGRRDVNAEMVRQGWATAYRNHSLAYVAQEAEARAAKRGIWRGSFENPQRWRERHYPLSGFDT